MTNIRAKAEGLVVLIGLIILATIKFAQAHPQSDCYKYIEDQIQQPDCHYVQVVNPVTGVLEQQYVCE